MCPQIGLWVAKARSCDTDELVFFLTRTPSVIPPLLNTITQGGGGGGCYGRIESVMSRINAHAQFCCLVCGVLAPGKLLPSPKEPVADPLPKHLLFGWWRSPVQLLAKP